MQEAIRLIKQDLGSEAVIVSSYKVPGKGLIGLFSPRLLEVTAVLDENPEIKLSVGCPPAQMAVTGDVSVPERELNAAVRPQSSLPSGRGAAQLRRRSLYVEEHDSEDELSGSDLLARELKKELVEDAMANRITAKSQERPGGERKTLFETMVNTQIKAGQNGDPGPGWRKTLLNMEIQESIVDRLLQDLSVQKQPVYNSEHLYFSLQKQVADLLETAYHTKNCARVLAFVGPPGVGKTTTLVKLATKFSVYENKSIAIVAICNYRTGVLEQLKAHGNFLKIPVEVVMTPAELVKALDNHADKDLVLIDTSGRSSRNAGEVLELKGFLAAPGEPLDIFLVLSVAAKNRDLAKTAHEFRRVGYSKFIFTQIDETETHGSILNLVCDLGTPVAYLSDGQRIPDDISEANPKKIAKLLFKGVDPDEIVAT
jgi:flagellar biosynthesis protein FlhF